MTLTEAHDLLTLIARVDNRRFDDATVLVWRHILGDLRLDDCRRAAIIHFGRSEAYLMPIHICQGVEELHREQERAALLHDYEQRRHRELDAAEAAPPTRDRPVAAMIHELADRFKIPRGDPAKLRGPAWRQRTRAGLRAAAPLAIEPSTPVTSEPVVKPEDPTPKEHHPDAAPAA